MGLRSPSIVITKSENPDTVYWGVQYFYHIYAINSHIIPKIIIHHK